MPTLNPEEPELSTGLWQILAKVEPRQAVISIVTELVEVLAGRRVPAWSRYSRLSSRTVNGSYRDNGHSTIGGRIETPANSMTACKAVFAKV
jgi:hypothetical protein